MRFISKFLTSVTCLFLASQANADLRSIPCPSTADIYNITAFTQVWADDERPNVWHFYAISLASNPIWNVAFTKQFSAKNETDALAKAKTELAKVSLTKPNRVSASECDYAPANADFTLISFINVVY